MKFKGILSLTITVSMIASESAALADTMEYAEEDIALSAPTETWVGAEPEEFDGKEAETSFLKLKMRTFGLWTEIPLPLNSQSLTRLNTRQGARFLQSMTM